MKKGRKRMLARIAGAVIVLGLLVGTEVSVRAAEKPGQSREMSADASESVQWEYDSRGRNYKLLKGIDPEGKEIYYTQDDGVVKLGGTPGFYYAFDKQGYMVTGSAVINGARYYFTPESEAGGIAGNITPDQTTLGMAVRDCWVRIDHCWLFFDHEGQQDLNKTGLQKINGYWYVLDKNGVPAKDCFRTTGSKKYYYGSSGRRTDYTGWKTVDGKKYYFNEKHYVIAMPGWRSIGGKKYYFTPKGVMYSQKWAEIKGKRYYFKENGEMASGWTKIKGKYYCFKSNGESESCTVAKQGKHYYLVNEKGARGADILKNVGIKKTMDKEQKLRACFDYVVKEFGYLPGQVWPPKGWEPYHAYKIMTTKRGNCYDYSAAFCYMARAVGYKAMICVPGQRSQDEGGYRPHCWCELKGKVYELRLTDPKGRYPYHASYENLPYVYKK